MLAKLPSVVSRFGRGLLLLFLLLASGCSLLGGGDTEPEATKVAAEPTPEATPTLQSTPQATEPAGPPLPAKLNVWLLEGFDTASDTPGGTVLAEQLTAFETNHPDIELDVQVKSPTGQGGTLSYLRSGRTVAPTVMPDLIMLPVDALGSAASEQLIYPLDEVISEASKEDLYSVARTTAVIDSTWYGYPMALSNMYHFAYYTSVFTETVPTTWDELLAVNDATFGFPGAGVPGAELLLQFYLASGGTVVDESGRPRLEVEPLTSALSLFAQASIEGLIPIESRGLLTLDESWQAFTSGALDTVQTAYGQQVTLSGGFVSGLAPLPGVEEPLWPLLKGWAWAISTPDPSRQALAAELMNWLTAGPNMGDWSRAAAKLPSRVTAFEQWPTGDPYAEFLQAELENAQAFPESVNNTMLNALSTAIFEVISLRTTPQQAAEAAAAALEP